MSNATKRSRVIFDAKYEKVDLHKIIENQCQHLTMTKHNEFLKIFIRFEKVFEGSLGTWKKYPVDFGLREERSQSTPKHIYYQRYTRK